MNAARPRRSQRQLIAAAVVLLGLLNITIAALAVPFVGFAQFHHLVPGDIVNGGRFILVILGILLVATAPGLWTGKRVAWGIALACASGSVLAHSIKNVNVLGMGAGIAMIVILATARRDFPARSDPPTARRGLIMLVGGLAFVYIYSTLGLYFLDREFVHSIPFVQALKDSLRLMFILPATEAAPKTRHGSWLVDSVRVAFLFVMVLGILQLVRPVIYRAYTTRRERERVRDLLQRYADSSIAYFALLPDKLYFFSDSGNAVIAYKTVGANAIAMGDPIGDQTEFLKLLSAFLEYCDLNGWACAFHQARPKYLGLYETHNLKRLKIGEEAVVPTAEFSLEGHEMKRLRSTLARFEREGYRTEVLSPPHDAALLRRLREISDEWLALGKRRERTFTVGYFDEALLQECDIMVAPAPDGQIVAFASIIPSYNMPEGNFDMVRYSGELHGLSDFLHVALIKYFREQGRPGMNLGLAPFSGIERGEARSPVGRAMRLLYSYGGFLFRAKGLREFKGKFRPRWEPRYLIFGSDLELPGIALAVARAGELRDRQRLSTTGPRPRLRRYVRLFPGAIAFALLMLLISAITTALKAGDLDIEHAIGLSVHALKTGRLWVIPIATLVQSEPLIKWLMPIFVFASIAVLEYQIGTLRAVVTFFLTDWISSPITALVIWGLGSAGLATAQRLENVGGTGASAAGFGALAAGFVLLREPWRRLMLVGTAVYLVGQFTFERLDVSIAHVIAAPLGLAMAWFFWRRHVLREINTDELFLTRPLIALWGTLKRERAP
jgi:phosphatidylglycerol lysyltransferase